MLRYLVSLFLCLILATTMVSKSGAAEPDDMLELPDISFSSFNVAGVSQREANMARGGQFSVDRAFLSANHTVLASQRSMYSFSLSYQSADYDFSGPGVPPLQHPWGVVQQVMFTPSYLYSFAKDWLLYAAPLFGYAGETGADAGKSMQYGAILSVSHRFSSDLSMGLGAGVFQRIEDLRGFPVFSIRWQITERLRLANSFRIGPAGPAGLELVYALDENWELAGGGVRRSNRFRLSETGPVSDGIGEEKFSLIDLRLSRKLGPHFKADLYAGSVRNGGLFLENKNGQSLASTDYDKTPILGLTLTGIF